MTPAWTARRGVTLLELVVVLAILSVLAAVTGVTMHTAAPRIPPDALQSRIASLRDSALASGQPVTAIVDSSDHTGVVTAYPDGSVLSPLGGIERVTGRPRAAK